MGAVMVMVANTLKHTCIVVVVVVVVVVVIVTVVFIVTTREHLITIPTAIDRTDK